MHRVCLIAFDPQITPSHRAWHTTLSHIGRVYRSQNFLRSRRVDKIGGTNCLSKHHITKKNMAHALLLLSRMVIQFSQLDIHKSKNFKGYTALLGENTNPENRGDLHEGFDLGWEDPGSGTVRSSKDD